MSLQRLLLQGLGEPGPRHHDEGGRPCAALRHQGLHTSESRMQGMEKGLLNVYYINPSV
jgi:hypothetical protein